MMRFAKLLVLLCGLLMSLPSARAGLLNAVYNSATDVPVTVAGDYNATGVLANFTLNFAPPVGTNLTVVKLGALGRVTGTFVSLAQWQKVRLSFGGQYYDFVLNYAGGTGNDIVLQWANARALAWGNNGSGQLGNNTFTTSNLPFTVMPNSVLAGKTVVAMSAGRNHTLALCSDGTVAAWGDNGDGQIGPTNLGTSSKVPVTVSGLGVLSTRRVIAVAAGEKHSLALCSDGSVAAWGFNGNGQLGNGGSGITGTPVLVNPGGGLAGQRVVAIAAGQSHSMALRADGKVATWGYNFNGQLGNGSTTGSNVPVGVNSDTGPLAGKIVAAIAAGQTHCLALCSDGLLVAWGANGDGQLGIGTSGPGANSLPLAVTTTGSYLAGRSVTSIAAGAFHSLALCTDGTIAAWGQNASGQLGTTPGSPLLAGKVDTTGALLNKTVIGIDGGQAHSLALCSDGTLTAWGANAFGQLGTGNPASSTVPQNVSTTPLYVGEKFAAAFSGPNASHSLGIVAAPPLPGSFTQGTLISNGSFETGFMNWSVSDLNSPFKVLVAQDDGYTPGYGLFSTNATDGNFSATSGFEGFEPGIVRLAHNVPVTAAQPLVRFDYRAGWDMSVSNSAKARTFSVTIEPSDGGPVWQSTVILTAPAQTKNLDTGALTGAVDLSAYIGTTVRVCFDLLVPEVNKGPGFFQLDNVRTAALLPSTANPITRAATALTTEGGTLNGTVNAGGLNTVVEFEWGLTASYGNVLPATPLHVFGNTDTPVSAMVFGVTENTVVHYRVRTTNSAGVKVGADTTFTTLTKAPVIEDFGTSSVQPSAAALYATVNPNGGSTVVEFEYGLTTAYGSSAPAWENPVTATHSGMHAQISGLTGGATYHWRVKAVNAGGTTYSTDATFTSDTPHSDDPTVRTLTPTMVERRFAQLNGSVNANAAPSHLGSAFLLPVMRNVFSAGSETFGLMFSPDNFATVSDFALGDLATAPGQGLRDPCLLRVGSTWYCFCTLDAWSIAAQNPNQNKFRILTSQNLTTWTTLADITVPGATQSTWAPKAFYDAASNRIYVSISSDRAPAVGAHDPKLGSASLNDLTTWSGWTTVSSLLPTPTSVFWDFQLSTDGTHYYAAGVSSAGAGSIKIYRSDTIDSGYTLFSDFDFGGGEFAEQCWLEWLGGTNWEIYYCKAQLKKICRRTSSDGMATWSTETLLLDYANSAKSFACPFRLPAALTPGSASSGGVSVSPSFEFGTTTQYLSSVNAFPSAVGGSVDTLVGGTRGGLSPGTTYHYRTRAYGPNGFVYGPDVTFTTPAIGFPAASTEKATVVNQTTAILRGWASANSGPATTVSFEYGPDANYGSVATIPGSNTAQSFVPVQVQIPVAGDSVTYHYRIKATNNIGTTYGEDMTFTTPDSHEARLYDLVLYGGSLFPVFDRSITSYAMSIPFETASFALSPTASAGIGSVTVNGIAVASGSNTDPIPLNIGSNVISIVVTALDGVTQQTYTITVIRPAPVAGNLDLSFNGTGMVSTDLGGYNFIYGMAVQADGKIVAVGAATNGNDDDFAVVRYYPDGTPDTNFGGGTGKVTTDFAARGDTATAVAVQGDGRIIVAGSVAYGASGPFVNTGFGVARYQADGTPDTTFNGTGKVITPFPALPAHPDSAGASSIAVQGDGKILVAGYAQNGTDYDFVIVRYHGDFSTGTPGTLDTTFGGTGRVVTHMGGDDFANCMALQPDGKILLAGQTTIGGTVDSAMARYLASGTLDTTFNGNGKLIVSLGTDIDSIYGLAVQPDGKIVTAGMSSEGGNYDFAVARFHGDIATGNPGTFDTTFGGTGKVITAIGTGDDFASSIALQGDGKVVVVGSTVNGSGHRFAVLRYKADGTPDTTFHGDGMAAADFGTSDETASCMALQGDGKILVAGSMYGIFNDFAIARFLGDGPAINVQTAPATNAFDGLSTVQFPGALPGANASVTFTIQNTGTASLTGLGLTVDGTDAGAFTVTANPVAPVAPLGTTTFTVHFHPASPGAKNAVLHIASNVTGSNGSYDIVINGTGLSPMENWRQQFFGSPANAGDGADLADPNGNGVVNLLEYALGGDPFGDTTGTAILPQIGRGNADTLQITFSRYPDRTDLTLTVLAADSPAGPWTALTSSIGGAPFVVLTPGATALEIGNGNWRSVTVTDLFTMGDSEHPARFIKLDVAR